MTSTSERRTGWTACIGVGIVAVTAAVISFSHVRHLAAEAGETQLATLLLPISIDGAIVAAVAVILADSRAGRRPTGLTWLLLTLGLAGSLAANIASAEPTLTARAIAAWPPVGLALGIEVLAGLVRRRGSVNDLHEHGLSAPTPSGGNEGRSARQGVAAKDANAGTPPLHRPAGRRQQPADADAVAAIRQLDAVAPDGRASRLEIQRHLQCGGSRAARLADLARRPAGVALPGQIRSVSQQRDVSFDRNQQVG